MNCPVCNTQLKENESLCKNCGTPLTLQQRAFSTYRENQIIKPLKTREFILMYFLKLIPLVNIIVYIIWAIKAKNLNRKAYARATLIFSVFETALFIAGVYYLSPYITKLLSVF